MQSKFVVASPNPAFHILVQHHAATGYWVYRVFGPDAAWFGTFRTAHEAVAFVRQQPTSSPAARPIAPID